MIHLACNIPKDNFFLACSGGVDSMVALDFLLKGKRRPNLLYVNHGTEHGKEAEAFVHRRAVELSLSTRIWNIAPRPAHLSEEEHWRNERYKVFHAFPEPVITAHHLDDAVEWWIMSALHGNPRLTPVTNKNVIRPFLFTPKQELRDWAARHDVSWIEDPTNATGEHARNVVRHEIMKHALTINPGLHKTVRKLYDRETSLFRLTGL